MGRSVLVSALVLTGVAACGQGGIGQHRLVGTVYEDRNAESGFEMAFTTGETVEVRMDQRSTVATCSWIDRTSEAEARGENTTYQLPEYKPYTATGDSLPTNEPASFRIEVSCRMPMGSAFKRFELAFSKDLETATRIQEVGDFRFVGGSSDYDPGRALTRVGA